MRLIRCLLYGFVDYSGFEKVIESYRSVMLLTDLELTITAREISKPYNNYNYATSCHQPAILNLWFPS